MSIVGALSGLWRKLDKLTGVYETIEAPFAVDISTGDVITPHPVKFVFRGIFDDDKKIVVLAYNIETIMAEKIETVLRRNTLSTRPRDYYDIFIMSTTRSYDPVILGDAISATAEHRGAKKQISDVEALLTVIAGSKDLKQMWEKYRREFEYATDISYELVIKALRDVCKALPPISKIWRDIVQTG